MVSDTHSLVELANVALLPRIWLPVIASTVDVLYVNGNTLPAAADACGRRRPRPVVLEDTGRCWYRPE